MPSFKGVLFDAEGTLFTRELLQLKPRSGLYAFLKILKEKQIPCAIVTSMGRDGLENVLDKLELRAFMQFAITHNDVDGRTKPDPYPYELGCQKLGFDPKEVLAFEDSQSGLTSSTGAGLYSIGIQTPRNNTDTLAAAGQIIGDFSELKVSFSKGSLSI